MTKVISNSTELTQPVLFPKNSTNESVTDLAYPLELLLIDLGINPLPEDAANANTDGNKVPASVAIIEAGATQFSKGARNLIAGAGGVAAIAAYGSSYWNAIDNGVRVASVAGAAAVLVAAIVTIGIIVASDVKARAAAAAAQYGARAEIAGAYLRGAAAGIPNAPAPAGAASAATTTDKTLDPKTAGLLIGVISDDGLRVHLKNGDDHTAHKVRFHDATGELEVRCGPADWRVVSEIVAFDPPS